MGYPKVNINLQDFDISKSLSDGELTNRLKKYYTKRSSKQNILINALISIIQVKPSEVNTDCRRRNVEQIARYFIPIIKE